MYKIGTRVVAKKEYEGNSKIINKSGQIVTLFADKAIVEFDENIGGHAGNGFVCGKPGHCWTIPNSPEYLQPDYSQMKEEKILIMATDDIVEARFFSNGEVISGFAQCSSEDNFDNRLPHARDLSRE